MEADPRPMPAEPPRGAFQANVDPKGRLKLPAAFQQYLGRLGEQKVFITTLDNVTARIYPIQIWRANEILLQSAGEDAEDAADVKFIANDMGGDSEIDAQGRVLVPAKLRRELKLEGQPVWLDCHNGRLNVYSIEVYAQRKHEASANLPDKLKRIEKRGFL